jgi:hypothetical protein
VNSIQYNSSRKYGGHIVKQYLPYINREEANKNIVNYFKERRKARSDDTTGIDKSLNPLIAIPGSPGSGKSTFFVHFPDSNEYKDYCKGDNNESLSPIVSTLTFNGEMNNYPVSFGLRILYGAARSMTLIDETVKWSEFTKEVGIDDIEADDAVQLLRRVFGKDRPILILVDEVSKAVKFSQDCDTKIMRQIGDLLDNDGNTDVIMSSLSPNYVETLVTTNSQRNINYEILPPLINEGLGRNECQDWANETITKIYELNKNKEWDEYKKNLLNNTYLLMSGHPRSIEHMVDMFHNKNWDDFASLIHKNTTSLPQICEILCNTFSPGLSKYIYDSETLENYIFSHLV